MRNLYVLLISVFSLSASAQVILNSDFESWTSDTQLNNWTERNAGLTTIYNAPSTILKSTNKFSGNFALKVQNSKGSYTNRFGTKKDTVLGGIVTTDVSIKGKNPPAYLKGHINYSLVSGETAEISISYKQSHVSGFTTRLEAIQRFTGTSGGSYVPFAIPINPYYHPDRFSDTLFISISTYMFETEKPHPVSELSNVIVDSLGFFGTMPAIQVPALGTILNGGFEAWTTTGNKKQADNWYLYGTSAILGTPAIEQTPDFHSGNFAMKMSQDHFNESGVLYALSRAATDTKYINGYAKFNLSAIAKDTLNVVVFKYSKGDFGDKIFATKKFAGSQTSYQPFSIKLDNTVMPNDTLLVFFYYQNSGIASAEVSTFLFDDIQFSPNPLGIEEEMNAALLSSVSPNPSSTGIYYLKGAAGVKGLKVYNSTGTQVEALIRQEAENIVIDISNNSRGVYFIYSEEKAKNFRIVY